MTWKMKRQENLSQFFQPRTSESANGGGGSVNVKAIDYLRVTDRTPRQDGFNGCSRQIDAIRKVLEASSRSLSLQRQIRG